MSSSTVDHLADLHHEGDRDPVALHPILARSALAAALLPEPFMASLYRITAPYRGCAHGCVYCDG